MLDEPNAKVLSRPEEEGRSMEPKGASGPLVALSDDIEDMLEDFYFGRAFSPFRARLGGVATGVPTIDGIDREDANKLCAEMPRLTEDDFDLRVSERRFGSFERMVRILEGVEKDKIEATVKNGVLAVNLPKKPELRRPRREVEVKGAEQGANEMPPGPTFVTSGGNCRLSSVEVRRGMTAPAVTAEHDLPVRDDGRTDAPAGRWVPAGHARWTGGRHRDRSGPCAASVAPSRRAVRPACRRRDARPCPDLWGRTKKSKGPPRSWATIRSGVCPFLIVPATSSGFCPSATSLSKCRSSRPGRLWEKSSRSARARRGGDFERETFGVGLCSLGQSVEVEVEVEDRHVDMFVDVYRLVALQPTQCAARVHRMKSGEIADMLLRERQMIGAGRRLPDGLRSSRARSKPLPMRVSASLTITESAGLSGRVNGERRYQQTAPEGLGDLQPRTTEQPTSGIGQEGIVQAIAGRRFHSPTRTHAFDTNQ